MEPIEDAVSLLAPGLETPTIGSMPAQVTIKKINGDTTTVSLELPAARQIKAMQPLLVVKQRLNIGDINLPPRRPAEAEQDYYLRVGMPLMEKFGDVVMALVGDEIIEAAAAIIGTDAREVGENYQLEELMRVVLPFFSKVFSGLMRQAGDLLGNARTPSAG